MPVDLPSRLPAKPRPSFVLSGRMVLAGFIGFFVVVAGVNAIMMTAAIKTMSGVEAKSAYETSQRFNGEIARMHAQAERGWQAQAQVNRTGADAEITLSLLDNSGTPVPGLGIEAQLQHPANRSEDRIASLVETGSGRYAAKLPAIHGGAWTLTLEARRDGEAVFSSRSRILLKE